MSAARRHTFLTVVTDVNGKDVALPVELTEVTATAKAGHACGARSDAQRDLLKEVVSSDGGASLFDLGYCEQLYRAYQIGLPDALSTKDREQFAASERLILFNVVVGLEWQPTKQDFQQLKDTLRKASNFLYDVTNGYMAFGQVIIASGPDALRAADIQLFASNRLYPRAGLLDLTHTDNRRVLPVRVGRGLWNRRLKRPLAWDEPEGWRVLIHEWAHYALGLPDLYPVERIITAQDSGDEDQEQAFILPEMERHATSIMAHLHGLSEFQVSNLKRIRQNLCLATTSLDLPRIVAGPGEMPLALPRFHVLAPLSEGETVLLAAALPEGIADTAYEHCWLYGMKGTLDAPTRLVAQGTLDSLTTSQGFRLLDVAVGDWLLLSCELPGQALRVWRGTVHSIQDGEVGVAWETREVTPSPVPTVTVFPVRCQREGASEQATTAASYKVKVQVEPDGGGYRIWLFERGSSTGKTLEVGEESGGLMILDGHVLLSGPGGMLVAPFSQGGVGAGQEGANGAPPHTAGSADGMVMLLFGVKSEEATNDLGQEATEGAAPHNEEELPIRLLTTRNVDPQSQGGYLYRVASTDPLPKTIGTPCDEGKAGARDMIATLLLYYDLDGLPLANEPIYCNHEPVDSEYLSPNPRDAFVAMALTCESVVPLFTGASGALTLASSFQLRYTP